MSKETADMEYPSPQQHLEGELFQQPMPTPERIAKIEAALRWYGEQARLARLIHSEGDKGRHALADDGGKRARAALASEGQAE